MAERVAGTLDLGLDLEFGRVGQSLVPRSTVLGDGAGTVRYLLLLPGTATVLYGVRSTSTVFPKTDVLHPVRLGERLQQFFVFSPHHRDINNLSTDAMDPERVRAYLQAACAGLGFDVGEVWWTSSENGSSTVAAIGEFFFIVFLPDNCRKELLFGAESVS